jgi:hypothetical protein
VQSGAVGEGVVAPVDAGVEAAAGKAAATAGSPGRLKLFLATKAGKITAGVAVFVVVAAIALGVGLGLGLKKSGELTANIGGATALYVVPGTGSASGRRLLDSAVAGSGKVQGSDGKAVDLEVRAHSEHWTWPRPQGPNEPPQQKAAAEVRAGRYMDLVFLIHVAALLPLPLSSSHADNGRPGQQGVAVPHRHCRPRQRLPGGGGHDQQQVLHHQDRH